MLAGCGGEPLGPAPEPGRGPRLYIEQDYLLRTFEPPVGLLSADGRRLSLSVVIRCTPVGERGQFEVAVTQEETGARAEGRFIVTCSGEERTWAVAARAQGPARFVPEEALACAALTGAFGDEPRRIAWCRSVDLQKS